MNSNLKSPTGIVGDLSCNNLIIKYMADCTISVDILAGGMFLLLPIVVISLGVELYYNHKPKDKWIHLW